MSIVFISSFEQGDMGNWQGASGGALETTVVRHNGSCGWRWNVSDGTGYGRLGNYPSEVDLVWATGFNRNASICFAFHVTTLPGEGQYYYLAYGSGYDAPSGTRSQLRINDEGKLEIWNATGTSWETGNYILQTGRWYVLWYDPGRFVKGPPQYALYRSIDTTTPLETKTHSGGNPPGGIQFITMGPYSSSYGNVVFCDIIYQWGWDEQSEVANPIPSLIGSASYRIESLIPIGVGTDDTYTGTYDDVDDWPHESATFRAGAIHGDDMFTQEMEDISGEIVSGNILAVMATNWWWGAGPNDAQQMRWRTGGTVYSVGIYGGTIIAGNWCRLTNLTGGAWTEALVNSLQIGASARHGMYANKKVCAVIAEVLYRTPSSLLAGATALAMF